MPPALLANIRRLLSYQTGRCLLTLCDCHTYTRRKPVEAIAELLRAKYIITVGDSSYFVYAQHQRVLFSVVFLFFLTILIFLFLVLTHLGATHKSLSAYSGGFCEPVTYKVSPYLTTSLCHSGLKCLPHDRYCDVRKRWQDLLRVIFLRIGPPPVLGFWKKGTSQAAVTLYVNKRYEWRCRECK